MRHSDWVKQLHTHITAALGRPFSWGENDCCLFASDACLAVCGVDPAASYRGRYHSAMGAARVLKSEHGSISAAFDAHFSRVDPALAQRGDVVLFDGEHGETVGVVWAGGIWSTGPEGLGRVDATPLVAWRVE
ncbi:hypothetical protein MRB56_12620 [Halomonas cupida]|uniref:DUF6950 family protein n=1 Tax=Halomonas cupida TaxID=44933 RepID=UPI0039B6639B